MQLETCSVTGSLAAQGVGSGCVMFSLPGHAHGASSLQPQRDEVFVFLPWFSLSGHWSSRNTNEAHSFLLISNSRSLWGSPLQLGTPTHLDVTLMASCIAQCVAPVIFLPINGNPDLTTCPDMLRVLHFFAALSFISALLPTAHTLAAGSGTLGFGRL